MHLFAVLGDPVRFRVIEILASGSHTAGEVTDAVVAALHISRSAVSHHLRILRDEGAVEVQEDENRRLYRLRWNVLDQVDRILLGLYEKWDRRVEWPYRDDPLASPTRRHRLAVRATHPVVTTKSEVEPLAPEDESEWILEDEDEDDQFGDSDGEIDEPAAEPAPAPEPSGEA